MTTDNDMRTHTATYHKVLGVLKYGGVACFIIALGVLFLITRK